MAVSKYFTIERRWPPTAGTSRRRINRTAIRSRAERTTPQTATRHTPTTSPRNFAVQDRVADVQAT